MQLLLLGLINFTLIALSFGIGQNVTVQRTDWTRVFSRKQRYVIFPKSSTLKFTCFLTKGFLASYPKGMAFVLEAAFYYPLPGQRSDLIPKRLRPTTTAAPKRPTQSVLVCIPGSDICYKAKPLHRNDNNANNLILIDKNQQNYYNRNCTNQWSKYDKYSNTAAYEQKYAWTPTKTSNKQAYDWHKWENYEGPKNRYPRSASETSSFHLKHLHSHMERRQLFHNFEGFNKIFGFQMKECILRSICDAKRFLLPRGYSLIHDILRIIFTFPTLRGIEDEYTQVMESTFENCNQALQDNKCPINLLQWFAKNYVLI